MLLLTALLAGCGFDSEEVLRVTSPSGSVDAVVIEGSAGATTPFVYEVCLVAHGGVCRKGAAAASLIRAERSDRAYGVNIRWADSQHLLVEYLRATSTSIHRSPSVVDGQAISISLQSGLADENAPQGGMYYNMHRSRP
jgi:hypothetical protein